jgi:hypothetical protein
MGAGQTRALAMADGQAWTLASDDDAVSVTYDGMRFFVLPRGPGWTATTRRITDVHDPALPLGEARSRTTGVLLIDDGPDASLFVPVTEAVLA